MLKPWLKPTVPGTDGAPQAPLLPHALFCFLTVILCLAEGHRWLHHSYISLHGRPRQNLGVSTAHHSGGTSTTAGRNRKPRQLLLLSPRVSAVSRLQHVDQCEQMAVVWILVWTTAELHLNSKQKICIFKLLFLRGENTEWKQSESHRGRESELFMTPQRKTQ